MRVRINSGPLEALIEHYNLYINNEVGVATRPKSTPGVSIIDLSLTTRALSPLVRWLVDPELPTGSDHELILIKWGSLQTGGTEPQIQAVTS